MDSHLLPYLCRQRQMTRQRQRRLTFPTQCAYEGAIRLGRSSNKSLRKQYSRVWSRRIKAMGLQLIERLRQRLRVAARFSNIAADSIDEGVFVHCCDTESECK